MMSSDAIYHCDNFQQLNLPLIFLLDNYPTIFYTVKANWKAVEP